MNYARLDTGGPDQAQGGVIDEYDPTGSGGDGNGSIGPLELDNCLSDQKEAGLCTPYEQQIKQEVVQIVD